MAILDEAHTMAIEAHRVARYPDVSLAHSVVVDVLEVAEAPGNLRTITIHDGLDVTIEFETCTAYLESDIEGGGLKYVGHYDTIDDAIADLEDYLGTPVQEWINFTENPYEPTISSEPDPAKNLRYFEDLVRQRRMILPKRGGFELAGIYWRHIELFGEYRKDKLKEEWEHHLRKRGISVDDDDDMVS